MSGKKAERIISIAAERESARRRVMEVAFKNGRWFRFPRWLLLAFTERDAVMLAYLINVADRCSAEQVHDGWFYCKAERMMAELFCDKQKQTKTIRSLRQKNVLECVMRGHPAKRFIKIDYKKVIDLIDAAHDKWVGKTGKKVV